MSSPFILWWPCLRYCDIPSDPVTNKPIPVSTINPNPKPISQVLVDPIKKSEKEPLKTSHVPKITTDSSVSLIESTHKQPKTFSLTLSNLCDIPTSQLPQLVLKGDNYTIAIPEEEVDIGINSCKFNLHARVICPKVQLISLILLCVKVFYEFSFSSLEDVKRVKSTSLSNLNPGVLKLFAWTRNFNPKIQNTTSTQVWLRIYGLSQEYWRPKILFSIANCNIPIFLYVFSHLFYVYRI